MAHGCACELVPPAPRLKTAADLLCQLPYAARVEMIALHNGHLCGSPGVTSSALPAVGRAGRRPLAGGGQLRAGESILYILYTHFCILYIIKTTSIMIHVITFDCCTHTTRPAGLLFGELPLPGCRWASRGSVPSKGRGHTCDRQAQLSVLLRDGSASMSPSTSLAHGHHDAAHWPCRCSGGGHQDRGLQVVSTCLAKTRCSLRLVGGALSVAAWRGPSTPTGEGVDVGMHAITSGHSPTH